ncbi:12998_t:CDS:2, partial [Cetraspora pellucida]
MANLIIQSTKWSQRKYDQTNQRSYNLETLILCAINVTKEVMLLDFASSSRILLHKERHVPTKLCLKEDTYWQYEVKRRGRPSKNPKNNQKTSKKKSFINDKIKPYDIANDLLAAKSNATFGQLLQYSNQKRNLARALRRPPHTKKAYL